MSGASERARRPELLEKNGIDAWASVPREVILRAMADDQCLDSRLRHAMILWSWCGPEPCEAVVRKDARGYIVRDGAGKPVPARFKDLIGLLGLGAGMKVNVSRIAQAMVERGWLRIEGKVMYLVFKPSAPDPTQSVSKHANWSIAGVVVHANWLPADPVARHDAIRFIETVDAQWKTERNQANARARGLLRTGLSERGIIIGEEKKRLREERSSSSSVVPPATEEATTTNSPPSAPPEPGPPASPTALAVPPVDPAAVAEALAAYVRPDDAAIAVLMADCRSRAPDCTTDEVVAFVREKGPLAAGKRSPLGFLMKAVANCFEGGSFRALRGRPKPAPETESPTIRLMKERIAKGKEPW